MDGEQAREIISKGGYVGFPPLTKRDAEDLSELLNHPGFNVICRVLAQDVLERQANVVGKRDVGEAAEVLLAEARGYRLCAMKVVSLTERKDKKEPRKNGVV